MSDIKWVEGVIPAPGVCFSCGSADHANRRFVTFTKRVKMYGQVLLCDQCVNTVTSLPGLEYVPKIELEMAKTEAKVYRERVEPALDALRNIRKSFDDVCDEYLDADGTPKVPNLKIFKRRPIDIAALTGNKGQHSGGSGGFFDQDPNPAA